MLPCSSVEDTSHSSGVVSSRKCHFAVIGQASWLAATSLATSKSNGKHVLSFFENMIVMMLLPHSCALILVTRVWSPTRLDWRTKLDGRVPL